MRIFDFSWGVGDRHNHDRKLARSILEAIKTIPGLRLPETYVALLDSSPPGKSVRDWSRGVQIAVTIGLAMLDFFLFAMRFL